MYFIYYYLAKWIEPLLFAIVRVSTGKQYLPLDAKNSTLLVYLPSSHHCHGRKGLSNKDDDDSDDDDEEEDNDIDDINVDHHNNTEDNYAAQQRQRRRQRQ